MRLSPDAECRFEREISNIGIVVIKQGHDLHGFVVN